MENEQRFATLIPNLKGIFTADNVPSHPDDGLYIINPHPQHCAGKHWLAYWQQGAYSELFDTLGHNPFSYPFLHDWLNTLPQPIDWCHRRIQLKQECCLDYCIYYLCERPLSSEQSLSDFLFSRPRFRSIHPPDALLMTKCDITSMLAYNDNYVASYVKYI